MIVIAIIGLVAAVAIPNFVKARTTAQANACIENLKRIQGAIEQWALENKKAAGSAVTPADISGSATKHLKGVINTDIKCPGGGTYATTTVDENPSCTVTDFHFL